MKFALHYVNSREVRNSRASRLRLIPLLGLPFASFLAIGCGSSAAPDASGQPEGQRLYALYCKGCHGPDGMRGESKMRLSQSARRSEDEVLRIISEGRGAMPAWKGKLKPPQLQAVADHARELAQAAAR